MNSFTNLVESIEAMEPAARKELENKLSDVPELVWKPQPGPQTAAYTSEADLLLYGGAAGGGKTDLIIGLGLTQHKRVGIFRQQVGELSGIVDRMNTICRANGLPEATTSPAQWKGPDGRKFEFGHLERPRSEHNWQGRDHDLKAFDEAAQINPRKIIYVMGWNRSTEPGQRVRGLLASNPPLGGQGDYLLEWFGPWLNPAHELYPTEPGKLLWALFDDDGDAIKTIWCDGPEPVQLEGWDKPRRPKSRTFIPARMEDNKYLGEEYEAQIESMPKHIREALRYGNFMAAREDHPWQICRSDWIQACVERYERNSDKPRPPMLLLSVDVARGGGDKTTIVPLHMNRFEAVTKIPGEQTPTGQDVVNKVLSLRRDDCSVVVDMGGGYGGSPRDKLVDDHDINVLEFVPSGHSGAMDKHKNFEFANARAEAHFKFGEAIDPDCGEDIELPNDPQLIAQLTATRYFIRGKKIHAEPKEDVAERLGGSPDEADAVVMAWYFKKSAAANVIGKQRMKGRIYSDKSPMENYNPLAGI